MNIKVHTSDVMLADWKARMEKKEADLQKVALAVIDY